MDISVWLRAEAGLGPRHIWHIPHCVSRGSGWSLSMFQPRPRGVISQWLILGWGHQFQISFPSVVTGRYNGPWSRGPVWCHLGVRVRLLLWQCLHCGAGSPACSVFGSVYLVLTQRECVNTNIQCCFVFCVLVVMAGVCGCQGCIVCVCRLLLVLTSCLHGAGHICDCVTRLCHAVTTFHTHNQGLKGNSQICTQQGYTLYSWWHGEGEGWIPPSDKLHHCSVL